MDKEIATLRLGGNGPKAEDIAARWLGITTAQYRGWPERLHRVMVDRVIAAVFRIEAATALGLTTPKQYFSDQRGEALIEQLMRRVAIASVMLGLMDPVPSEFLRLEPEPRRGSGRRPYTKRKPPALATSEPSTATG